MVAYDLVTGVAVHHHVLLFLMFFGETATSFSLLVFCIVGGPEKKLFPGLKRRIGDKRVKF